MLANYEYKIINMDALTYAGNLSNLQEIEDAHHYRFVKGDICDRDLLNELFIQYEIDVVINFAANHMLIEV